MKIPLGSRPVLSWEGFDAIGQRARIEGDSERGFEFLFFDEEGGVWRPPGDLDEYRWIVEAFLAEALSFGPPSGS